jgi:hypothetical protein
MAKTKVTYRSLKVCGAKPNFILNYDIVGTSCCALQSFVRLEKEIPRLLAVTSDMAINDGARQSVK